jgi:hypothetical protein
VLTLTLFHAAPAAADAATQAARADTPLRLAIVGMADDLAGAAFSRLRDVVAAGSQDADLTWDNDVGAVLDGQGAVVSQPTGLKDLQGTIDKWRLLDRLEHSSAGHSLAVDVAPKGGPHAAGSYLRISVQPGERPYLTVFNLGGTGELALLFPRSDDEQRSQRGKPFVLETVVTPPFGADHVVAIATAAPVPDLLGLLEVLDGHTAGDEVVAALDRSVSGMAYALGVAAVYTAP